ncbi:MAG: M15 family metallopeptidase [Brevinema sp.]
MGFSLLKIFFLAAVVNSLYSQDFYHDHEAVFKALTTAYPAHIRSAPKELVEHPYPALLVRDKIFYWIEGRLLPSKDIDKWKSFAPSDFYYYPKMPENPSNYSEELKTYLENTAKAVRSKKPRPSSHPEFWNTLYDSFTRSDTEAHLITDRFFRHLIVMHRFAWGPLKKVEAELALLSKTDSSVDSFLKEITIVYTYIWRPIANTKKRSLHSYGVGIDTVNTRNKKPVYWLWQYVAAPRQWLLGSPPSRRWNPPPKVVEIFEKYGFAWGGKWFFYDTIHFEYRPEILILNGYNVSL